LVFLFNKRFNKPRKKAHYRKRFNIIYRKIREKKSKIKMAKNDPFLTGFKVDND
jgi:hypothetical protein